MTKTLATKCGICGAIEVSVNDDKKLLQTGDYNPDGYIIKDTLYLSKKCFDKANPDWEKSSAADAYARERDKLIHPSCKKDSISEGD